MRLDAKNDAYFLVKSVSLFSICSNATLGFGNSQQFSEGGKSDSLCLHGKLRFSLFGACGLPAWVSRAPFSPWFWYGFVLSCWAPFLRWGMFRLGSKGEGRSQSSCHWQSYPVFVIVIVKVTQLLAQMLL